MNFRSDAHHHGSLPQQLGLVLDPLLKADPEGPSLIFHAALRHGFSSYLNSFSVPLQHTGKRHDELCIGINGKPLERKGIKAMVGRLSKARFDVTFGPHRFRHAIATAAPLRAPEHPALTASLLGISKDVLETHYNRSQQVSAVLTFQAIIEAKMATSSR